MSRSYLCDQMQIARWSHGRSMVISRAAKSTTMINETFEKHSLIKIVNNVSA